MDIYNFRIDQEHSNVLVERLKNEKCICMGWGGGDIFNLDLRHDDNELWHDYKKCYKEITTHRYNSICKIKYFIDGDIIVVPHLPVYGKFIIGIVEGDFENCYSYIENDETHLNHKIKLKKI